MKEELPFKILCPFCNKPYTAKMVAQMEWSSSFCSTCGPDAPTGTLEIVCEHCKKIVYKKEYSVYD